MAQRSSGALPAGTRVRFTERTAWPERVGAEGVVVAPAADGTYPQPAKNECVVLLDDDPLGADEARFYLKYGSALDEPRDTSWTCVERRTSLEVLP